MNKVTPFLMFNDQLEAAIEFYTATFPNSEVRNVARTGKDGPISSAEFVVGGQLFMGYNGGPYFSWTDAGVHFVFGYDAHANLVQKAGNLPQSAFSPLCREPVDAATGPRGKRENTKEQIVFDNGYKNIRLKSEEWTEFAYQPTSCKRAYRVIALKKNLSVEESDIVLFDDVKWFFYITNDEMHAGAEVIGEANARCNQENVIEQLKNGVNALRVPVNDLVSNWAYMVIASLAWTLKAWFGLTLPGRVDCDDVLRMEFKKFLNRVVRIPCQVIRGGHRLRIRLLGYTDLARLLAESLTATRAWAGT